MAEDPPPGAAGGDAAAPAVEPSPPPERGRAWWVRLAQLGLTVAVTWWILDRVGPGLDELARVDPAEWRPGLGLLVLSCALLAAGYAFSAVVWARMVRDLGGPRLGTLDAVRVYMVANLGRYVPGKVWQIAGLALLARRRGVPPAVATAAAVLGQGVALAGATLVGLSAVFGAGPRVRALAPWTVAGVVVVVAAVTVPALARRGVALWFRLARADLPERLAVGGIDGARWLALYTLNWGVYALSFWMLVKSFDLPGSILQVAPAFAAAYVLGYLMVFAPAGIGVREGFLVALLGPVMGAASAGVLAAVARVWTTGVEVVPALAFWAREVTHAPAASAGEGP